MKIKVPSKTVEVCDICQRQTGGVLTKCVVCYKEYCHLCEAIMAGCVHQPDVCKECAEHPKVKAVVERYAPLLVKLLKQRDRALKAQRGFFGPVPCRKPR
jgi:hypothetical protein